MDQELAGKKRFEYTVSSTPFARSPVDILIPFHGQYDKVTRLVESILLATRSNPYQICLIDDCSISHNYIEKFKKVPQVITVRNDRRLGFGASIRVGLGVTKQPWVIFLHSDCEIIQPNWMINMGESLLELKEAGVRMVSARSNNPGEGTHPALLSNAQIQPDQILIEPYLPLYCAMMHRGLFSRTNGALKEYPYVGYEDEEFAWRMKKFGFKQAVCGSSWVKHHGGATVNEMCKATPRIKAIIERNRDLCEADVQALFSGK